VTDDSTPSRARGRRALGRGLDALLPAAPEASGVRQIDVDTIAPNPQQPRQHFDRDRLEGLAASIREHGIVQPLVVTAGEDGGYRLIVGERRWQAARLAGLRQVPVVVTEATDRQTLELALIENVQRHDLNPLEEAGAYSRLIEEYGLTQAELAGRVGRSRAAVANTLRLLGLSPTLKRAVVDGRITEGHARALLALSGAETQTAVLTRIEREGLNVRQTEELVRRLQAAAPARRSKTRDADVEAVENRLGRALGTRVSIRPGRKGGKIVIDYYSDEDFDTLYRRLVGEE
jgi:ParB family chromosome partitioning protein